MNASQPRLETSGTISILAVSSALAPHAAWVIENIAHTKLQVNWAPQPSDFLTGEHVWAEIAWQGPVGLGAGITSALYQLKNIWFEVVEKASATSTPGLWMHTPQRGIMHVQADNIGNLVLTEDRIKNAVEKSHGSYETLLSELSSALGEPWDFELERLRQTKSPISTVKFFRAPSQRS